MFLKFLGFVPLIQCFLPYRFAVHRVALKKFFVLLLLTSLPVIVTVFMAPIPEGAEGPFLKFMHKFADSLTVSELFVYSATFLTPILYLLFERIQDISPTTLSEFRKVFRGYGLVTLLALIVIILTAVAFSTTKVHTGMSNTFLNYFLVKYSFSVYLFGLYCWYLTLLDGANSSNFVDATRNNENSLTSKFAARLEKRGE